MSLICSVYVCPGLTTHCSVALHRSLFSYHNSQSTSTSSSLSSISELSGAASSTSDSLTSEKLMAQSREMLLGLAGWMSGNVVLGGGRLFEVGHLIE